MSYDPEPDSDDYSDELGPVEPWSDGDALHHPECDGWMDLDENGYAAEHQADIVEVAPCGGCW